VVDVDVPIPGQPRPRTPTLRQLIKSGTPLLRELAQRGIRTVDDLRAAGGIRGVSDLRVRPDHPAVRTLDAHTSLRALSPDVRLNQTLIELGFDSPRAVARTSRTTFVKAAAKAGLGDFRAAQLHVAARAQTAFLDNMVMEARSAKGNGFSAKDQHVLDGFEPLARQTCGCKDCEAAVSPLAYLADLLEYTLEHVRNKGAAIDLTFLTSTFCQPFGDLPASCAQMDERAPQVRICIEVLRRYLAGKKLPKQPTKQADALAKGERRYRLEAYRMLLEQIGSSYDEIRLARTGDPDTRHALAERLGLDLAETRPDHVDELFLDAAVTPDEITEAALEALFGLVATTKPDPLVAPGTAAMQSWRLEHLRTLWHEQDWPEDLPRDIPVIDPDVVGPDDFRRPFAKMDPAEPDGPFDIWLARRAIVDELLEALRAEREANGLDAALVQTLGDPLPDLDALKEKLAAGTDLAQAQAEIDSLGLTPEGFTRLKALRTKDGVAASDPKAEPVSPDEWREVYSILAQSLKAALYQDWKAEEESLGLLAGPDVFGPQGFWVSLTEPKEGVWPPEPSPGVPLIDPELVKRDELPDRTAGERAGKLWKGRVDALKSIHSWLKAERESNGFEAMIASALGSPPPADLDALDQNLKGGVDIDATEQIINTLGMSVDGFTRLMTIRSKHADPAATVTEAEWGELYAIATSARKVTFEYPAWIEEEQNPTTGVVYWIALKARLPRWLASVESRQSWQHALRIRSGRPLIDPDLLGPADLARPVGGDVAFSVWQDRRAWVDARLAELKALRGSEPAAVDGIDAAIAAALGVTGTSLAELAAEGDNGTDLTGQLDQLSLSSSAFARLLRVRDLAAAAAPVLASEWTEADAVLVQALKRRVSAEWRVAEKSAGLVVGPDEFQIRQPAPVEFPPKEIEALPLWLACRGDRLDWLDVLQSRIDQEQSVIESLRAAVGDTEQAMLPLLRDALVLATGLPGKALDGKAKSVTDALLIDAKMDGCAVTTRVAQAIETLQSLLFQLRTRQLSDTYPHVELDADDFDAEWEWVGSLAAWRAAMFIWMHPELVLIPSLRKWQTPGLRTLVADLRGNRRLTPQQAREAAGRYSAYLEDVAKLSLDAACHAKTRTRAAENGAATSYSHLVHFFARGGVSGDIYWSAYDPNDESGHAQTFWAPVPGLEGALGVIGSVPYQVSADQRFIFVFARVLDKATEKLVFTTYDLDSGHWGDVTELELPEQVTSFSAVVRQRASETRRPHIAIRVPSGAIYLRKLNGDGTDWDGGTWHPICGRLRGSQFDALCALVEIAQHEIHLIARTPGGELWCRLIGDTADGRWHKVGNGVYIGALAWLDSHELHVFSHAPGSSATDCTLVLRGSGFVGNEISTIAAVKSDPDKPTLEEWLNRAAGVSLAQTRVPEGVPKPGTTLLDFFLLDAEDEPYKTLDYLGLGESMLRAFQVVTINWLGGKIAGTDNYADKDFGEWKLADELVRQCTTLWNQNGKGLAQVIHDALPTHSVVDGNKVKHHQPIATRFRLMPVEAKPAGTFLAGVLRIVPTWGSDPQADPTKRPISFQRSSGPGRVARTFVARTGYNVTTASPSVRLAPDLTGAFEIREDLSEAKLQYRRSLQEQAFEANADGPASAVTYLEEADYFVRVQIALQLQARGHYVEALDWFRSVYDFAAAKDLTIKGDERKISSFLQQEADGTPTYKRPEDWLLDPVNPHETAATRAGSSMRFTLLAIVRCLLDFADAEFTKDDAESVPRARILYLTALELLNGPELKQQHGVCTDKIGELEIALDGSEWTDLWRGLVEKVESVGDLATVENVVHELSAVLENGHGSPQQFAEAEAIIDAALHHLPAPPTIGQIVEEKGRHAASAHAVLLSHPGVAKAASAAADLAARDFLEAVSVVSGVRTDALVEGKARLPWLRQSVGGPNVGKAGAGTVMRSDHPFSMASTIGFDHPAALANVAKLKPWPGVQLARKLPPHIALAPSYRFCIPPNPLIKVLRLRAELNLFKLRTCRNIAGMLRELEPYAAPTDTISGLPTIGTGDQLLLPGLAKFPPTPYRFSVLIERAKQWAGIAQQLEASLLSTFEKADAERYTILQARQDVALAKAGVTLQNLRVKAAEAEVDLAELQQERAQIQVDQYEAWLGEGMSTLEIQALAFMAVSAGTHLAAAAAAGPMDVASGLSSAAAAASTAASVYSTLASYERRAEEWAFQKNVALQDVKIAAQQVKIAHDQVRVVGQERAIAEMQVDHAKDTVEFLTRKFTNVELYDWMSRIIEEVYSYFLQQATSIAQLAEAQLGFERQEPPPPTIRSDYWEAPGDDGVGADMGGKGPERHGLTGPTRLLRDLFELDQRAFETNRLKLQLSETFSLAALFPFEFQRFRETGLLTFATRMELYDRRFPGHYLRRVTRVQPSIIALVRPTGGIRATLTCSRLSRVVIGGDFFQTVPIQHGPDYMAFSSPREATGPFQLEPQSEMLGAFEGNGVDTTWEFRMPKAANLHVDFDAIADVLFTVDYNCLNSFDYRQQVIQTLKPTVSADRAFSFRYEFADQWYDLHNPELTATPMIVRFRTRRQDFPPNLDNLKIQHVVLYFSRADAQTFEVPVTYLHFTEDGGAGGVGGGAASIDGAISTRKGNAGSWMAMIGKRPYGEWELALPASAELKSRFKKGEIKEVLLAVTYSSVTPSWPL
jgi:hypothetical protein